MITIVYGNHYYKNVTFPDRRLISLCRAILEWISACCHVIGSCYGNERDIEWKGMISGRHEGAPVGRLDRTSLAAR